MSEINYIIKCVMCKAEFNQLNTRNRLCDDCKSYKSRTAREAYYAERKQIRKGFEIFAERKGFGT